MKIRNVKTLKRDRNKNLNVE